jgi:uncharacterized lipoprotein YajG
MSLPQRSLVLIAACLLLAACQTTGGNAVAARPAAQPVPAAPSPMNPYYEVDEDYVRRIEHQARMSGAIVKWLHIPTKRKTSAEND